MYVYLMKIGDRAKIGKARDPAQRLKELQTGNPFALKLIGCIRCLSDGHAFEIEKALHAKFRNQRIRGEWFKYTNSMHLFVERLIEQIEGMERGRELNSDLDREFRKIVGG